MSADRPTARHFRPDESDAFADRLGQVIGDEPVSSFARRCGFGESTLRGYLTGADPSRLRLVAMARAANVSVLWLATGEGDRVAATAPSRDPVKLDDMARLQATIAAVEEGLASIGKKLPPAVYAEVVVLAYEIMGQPNAARNVERVIRLAA